MNGNLQEDIVRKIRSLVVFLIVALVFFGCATTGKMAKEEKGRFYERTGGFSIMIPDAWEVQEIPGLKYKALVGPADNDFTPNINFVDETFDGSTDVYVSAVITQLKNLFDENIEILQRDSFVTSKNLSGEKVVFNTVQYGLQFRQILYCFPGNGIKIIATCTAAGKSGEAFAEMFDRTLATFEWIQ